MSLRSQHSPTRRTDFGSPITEMIQAAIVPDGILPFVLVPLPAVPTLGLTLRPLMK